MADLPPYVRTFSFTGYQANRPALPVPGLQIDRELDDIAARLKTIGKSAYDIAVLEGFTGTRGQWLLSLVGPRGPQGLPGLNGRDGAPGLPGKDGVQLSDVASGLALIALGGAAGAAPTMQGLGYQLYARRYLTGTAATGVNASLVNVEGDNAAITGPNFGNYFTVQGAISDNAVRGGRQAIQAGIFQSAKTNNANENRNYVGVTGIISSDTGDGGVGLGGPNGNNGGGPILAGQAAGGYFGMNPVAILVGYPFKGAVTSGSKTVTVSDGLPAGVKVGHFVREVGSLNGLCPEGTFIDQILSGTSFTVTQAATATKTASLGASGAQYVLNLSAMEVNPAAQAGCSLVYKSGIQIAALASDQVQGTDVDAAISISAQGGIGWRNGILFGAQNGAFPFRQDSIVFRATGGTVASALDFSGIACIDSLLKGQSGAIRDTGTAWQIAQGGSVLVALIGGASMGALSLIGRNGLSPYWRSPDDFTIRSVGGGVLDMPGAYTSGAPAAAGYVTVKVNGTSYKLLAAT